MMTSTALSSPAPTSSGGRLVGAPASLPLTAVAIVADARGGVARVVVTQRFTNPHSAPLAVTYAFPLPDDAAVSGYSFTVGGKRVVGEVDRRAAARERFEEALLEGKTAAILDQERTSLFTQDLGNVPPGAEVEVELVLDQRLAWRSEGAWEWRFPTATAPRYLGESGRVPDAARVTIDVADAPLPVRATVVLAVRDAIAAGARAESTSHVIRSEIADGSARVSLASEDGAALDRDVVVTWRVAGAAARTTIDVARPARGTPGGDAAYGLVTIVPPAPSANAPTVARDLVVLLDTSGSMNGAPLDQARRVVSAVVETLRDGDRLELIEFSSAARRWKSGAVPATEANRRAALAWLAGLRAAGGTEMRAAILEALAPLRAESQRQVIVVTDGYIGFEHEVVGAILGRLPPSSRVHTVGVGSAVNRSLTGPAARAGRGVEVVVGLEEDAERAAKRIVAATAEALVVDLTIEGSAVLGHAPARLPDLFAGAPALVSVKLRAEGGEIVVRGRTRDGAWEARVTAPACEPSDPRALRPAPVTLFARESVSDLEADVAAGAGTAGVAAAEREIERIGLELQIATRLTSWVAIAEEPSVDPGAPIRRVRVPQSLPHGMSMEGLGLRAPAGAMFAVAGAAPMARAMVSSMGRRSSAATAAAPPFAARAQVAPPPQAPGPLARAIGAVRGFFAETEAPTEAGGGAAATHVRGRITARKGTTMAIEVTVEGAPLAWAPGAEVTLVWADGATTRAAVIGGTRAGEVKPGDTLRLVLRLDPTDAARAAEPQAILVPADPPALVIALRETVFPAP